MKRLIVFLADGCEEIEALTVVDLLRRAGVEVKTVSITEERLIRGAHGIDFYADCPLSALAGIEYDALVLPGGLPGTTHLSESETVLEEVRRAYAAGKVTAAICAAPSVLHAAGVLQGHRATSYPSWQENLPGVDYSEDAVVRDGCLITSRGLGTAIPFALALVGELCGTEKAEQLAASVVYRV